MNLTHLLNLVQVTDAKDLPPIWKSLARASKHQQFLVLQRALDGTAEEMGLRAPTIATLSLIKLVLALGGEILCICDLHQVEEVCEVHTEVLRSALALLLFADALIFQAGLAKFHHHLSDCLSNTGACRAIYAQVQPGQVAE